MDAKLPTLEELRKVREALQASRCPMVLHPDAFLVWNVTWKTIDELRELYPPKREEA